MRETKQILQSGSDTKTGNSSFFKGHTIQPKLQINEPGDSYEQEADHMADKIMRMADPSLNKNSFFKPANITVQRKCPLCEEADKKLQRKENSTGAMQADSQLNNYVNSLGSSGSSMSASSRQFFEYRFGMDFSGVKIHTDSVAAKSAQSINALAYTTGNNIVFNSGQYSPESDSGKRLIAHELTHVVQQRGSIQPKLIQRSPGSPAGGCGLCYETTKAVGLAAHIEIQKAFKARYPYLQTEYPVLGSPTDENGKLDFADLDGSSHMSIGEVKPANPTGFANGEADLIWYEKQLNGLGMNTSRMNLPPPLAAIPFPTLAPPDCPQTQMLYVDPPVRGTYTYWCTPDYKDLVKLCDCKKGKRKLVPYPIAVPKKVTNEDKKKVPQQVPVAPPVVDPVPNPVPVTPPVVDLAPVTVTPPTTVAPPTTTTPPAPVSEGVPTWAYVAGGAAGALLIAACFASGACEVAGIIAAFGAAAEEVIALLAASGVVLRYAN